LVVEKRNSFQGNQPSEKERAAWEEEGMDRTLGKMRPEVGGGGNFWQTAGTVSGDGIKVVEEPWPFSTALWPTAHLQTVAARVPPLPQSFPHLLQQKP